MTEQERIIFLAAMLFLQHNGKMAMRECLAMAENTLELAQDEQDCKAMLEQLPQTLTTTQ